MMNLLMILAGSVLAPEARELSYEAALEFALQRNPSLLGAKLDVEAADGALLAAKGVFDPTLTAGTNSNQFTSESTREFGEVLSEFKQLRKES